MTPIDEIKARIDIVDLVSETVKLRRAGKSYSGFCPFHTNTRTPAFVVFPDSGTWRCFGQCNEGGDIFRYVMKKEGWDFSQSLKYLAQRAGVQLETPTPEKQEAEQRHDRLRALLEDAATFFHHQLTQTAPGAAALAYLHERGLLPETIQIFALGYAPDSWDLGVRYFTSKNYSAVDLIETGLVSERQDGDGIYDRFRNRIMFPIRDGTGRMAGFGARRLNQQDEPKFLNSPQTVLFDKGKLLYGLDRARKAIREHDQVVIVEGYLDVIALHQTGYTNTVSAMGTALTEDQFRNLKRVTRRLVLALDADAAGEKATLRGLETARQAMDHSEELVFNPRGLLRYEARLEADLRVTTLPQGLDPDEVALKDPEAWGQIIKAAKPIVLHVLEVLSAGRDLEDPKVKSDIVERLLPLIEDIPNPVERDTYRQKLARTLKLDERVLTGGSIESLHPNRRAATSGVTRAKKSIELEGIAEKLPHTLEAYCLSLLLGKPDTLYQVDRALLTAGLTRLEVQDFMHSDHQVLARLVQNALEQEEMDPAEFLIKNLPKPLQDLVESLRQPLVGKEYKENVLVEDLVRSIMRLRLIRANENVQQLRQMQQELLEQGYKDANPYGENINEYIKTRARLDRALGQPLRLD
jgi:DNA primase